MVGRLLALIAVGFWRLVTEGNSVEMYRWRAKKKGRHTAPFGMSQPLFSQQSLVAGGWLCEL
jgi:hypothetical protein